MQDRIDIEDKVPPKDERVRTEVDGEVYIGRLIWDEDLNDFRWESHYERPY